MIVISALYKGLAELSDADSRSVLWQSIGLSALTLILTLVGAQMGLQYFPLVGIGWIDTMIQAIAGVGGLFIAWFLFPVVATAFIGIFLDKVSRTIEARDYTSDPAGMDMGTLASIGEALHFLAFALILNIIAFGFALLIPPLYPFIFFAANGYLIAREYFFQVGLRHQSRLMVRALYVRHRLTLLFLGVGLTLLLLIPFLNLCVPLIAVATMTHVYKGVARDAASA